MSYDPNRDPNSGHGNPSYGVPPQGPYCQIYGPSLQSPYAVLPYHQPDYSYVAPPAAPLPLGEAIRQLPKQYIKVLTKPSAATFADEQGKAAWNIVWVQLLALAVISAVLGYFASLTGSSLIPTTMGSMSPATHQAVAIIGSFGQIIGVPLGFFIGVGILYLIARAFGGQGTFLAQGYTYLLFDVPLGIITALLGLIPIFGGLVAIGVGIYALVLQIFSIMGVHHLGGGKATLVVFLPGIVVLALACIAVVIIITVFAHP